MEETISDIRAVADRIANIKSRLRDARGDAVKAELIDVATAGKLHIVKLREKHKQVCLEAEDARNLTVQAKSRLDTCNGRLQNLLYERSYYDKEINNCLSFQSAVPDEAIALSPLEEFQAAAPDQYAAAAADPHQLMLARLQHECSQRKALQQQLEELKKLKQKRADAVASRKSRLDALHSHLRHLAQAGEPLQKALAPQVALRLQHRHAELLPAPLYVVYSQFQAAKEVLGLELEVLVKGDVEEAQRLATTAAAAAAAAAEPSGSNTAAAGGAGSAPSAAQQQQQQGAHPSKRRRKESAGAAADDLYQVHPLSVELQVLPPPGAPSGPTPLVRLAFQAFTRLKLLGAYARDGEDASLLGNLFLGDTGSPEALEDLAALGAAAAAGGGPGGGGGSGDGGAAEGRGRGGSGSGSQRWQFGQGAVRAVPYRWVQELAGLDVLPSLPPGGDPQVLGSTLEGLATLRRQQRAAVVLERLQSAKLAQLALRSMLKALSAKRFPPTPLDAALLAAPTATLLAWAEVKPGSSTSAPGSPAPEAARGTSGGLSRPGSPSGGRAAGRGGESDEEGEVGAEEGRGGGGGGGVGGEEDLLRGLEEEDYLAGLLQEAGGSGSFQELAAAAEAAAAAAAEEGAMEEGGEEGGAGGEEGGVEAPGDGGTALEAASREYKLVVGAGGGVEVTVLLRVAANYPLTLPVVQVTKMVVRSGSSSSGKGSDVLHEPGKALWMETQVNAQAPRRAASMRQLPQVLALQLLYLRCCVEGLAREVTAGSSRGDKLQLLAAKRQLRGPLHQLVGGVPPAP